MLGAADVAERPAPGVWSPLEYACHVRDVHRIFDVRSRLMLDHVDPHFANWDQDATAIAEGYAQQDPDHRRQRPARRGRRAVADRYESVPPDAWSRRGYRSNGSEFTVASIGVYHLHDLVHHAWDVRAAIARATVEAYDVHAAAYRDGTTATPDQVADDGRRVRGRGSAPEGGCSRSAAAPAAMPGRWSAPG